MNILYIGLNLFFLFCYILLNILNLGKGSDGIIFILMFFLLSGIYLFFKMLNNKIKISYNIFIIFIIAIWITIRVTIDMNNTYFLSQILIGSTGGILFFLFIGIGVATITNKVLAESIKGTRIYINASLIILVTALISNLYLSISFIPGLRDDIFLLLDPSINYQRPGNFMSIFFIITSIFFTITISSNMKICSIKGLFFILLYFSSLILSLLNSQMIGSNNAFVVIFLVGMSTIFITFLLLFKSSRLALYTTQSNIILNKNVLRNIVFTLVLIFLILIVLLLLVVLTFNIDLTSSRILGFGSNTNSSLASRYAIIIDNISIHLRDSPIIGNINIDRETTGIGTYVHSFLLYAWTHTGLIGLFLFLILFFNLFQSFIHRANGNLFTYEFARERYFHISQLLILLFVFLIANIGTTIDWAVLWFTVGLVGNLCYVSHTTSFNKK